MIPKNIALQIFQKLIILSILITYSTPFIFWRPFYQET